MHSRYTTNHTHVSLSMETSATASICGDNNTGRPTKPRVFSTASIKQHINQPMHHIERKGDIVRGFSPAWYTVTMGTGSIGILVHNFPYHAAALRYIGMGLALFNLLLYVTISFMFIWRLIRNRDVFDIFVHPQLSMSLGAIPMGFTTIISALVVMLQPYNVSWMPMLALVLWWITVAFSVLCSLVVPFMVFTHQTHKMDSLSSTLLLPVVTNVVAASTGAVVASAFEGSNAVAVVLVSYMLWGMGMGTAMMLVTAYLMRLTLHGLPPKEAMASAFIPLGPMGQSSYGIQILGVQALRVFPKELPQIQYLGEILHALGFTLGIFIWALAFWWLMQGIYSALYTRVHGPIPFNLGWWALIFPVGTFASTSSSLWGLTGYTFYRVVTAFMVVGLFALWVFVLLHTIWYAWSGELFKPANIRRLELASTDANSDDDGESGIIERKKKIDV